MPRRWLRVLSELALRESEDETEEGAVECDAYDEAESLGECETSLRADDPSRRRFCTGKAGAGDWLFRKRSTAVGSFGLDCVFARARPIGGGRGDGRGASNQGLLGSLSGEFASVMGDNLSPLVDDTCSNEGALCLEAGMKGFWTAGSLNASNLLFGFELFLVGPADVVGRCSSVLRLFSGKNSVLEGAAESAGDPKPLYGLVDGGALRSSGKVLERWSGASIAVACGGSSSTSRRNMSIEFTTFLGFGSDGLRSCACTSSRGGVYVEGCDSEGLRYWSCSAMPAYGLYCSCDGRRSAGPSRA
jgi:hypothetical protein